MLTEKGEAISNFQFHELEYINYSIQSHVSMVCRSNVITSQCPPRYMAEQSRIAYSIPSEIQIPERQLSEVGLADCQTGEALFADELGDYAILWYA